MSDAPLTAEEVRELEVFLQDKRDVEAALIHARRFATKKPFADRKEAGEAADAIKVLNQTVKAADEHRLEATKTWRTNTDTVNTEYGELLSTIKTAAIPALKRKGLDFQKTERERIAAEHKAEQERIDKEAEEKAADSQAAAELVAAEPDNPDAKELAAEAFSEAAKAAVATAPAPMPAPKNLRGDYGALGSYTVWKFEVTDAALVPREHLAVNEKSIGAAVKAEKVMAKAQGRPFSLEIPGVHIFPDEIGVSR
jgi:hypothetical protein